MDPHVALAVAGLLIGALFGATVQRTHYCLMGALADLALFGSRRRLRSWLLAVAVALAGTQLLALLSPFEPARSFYLRGSVFWLGAVVGGTMFGFGMVLAGGCISRNLVRAGAGSLKAWLVVLLVAISAYATIGGILAPLYRLLVRLGSLEPAYAGLGQLAAGLAGGAGDPLPGALLGLLLAGGLLAWVFADPGFRRHSPELSAGVLLGALVVAGWWATALLPGSGAAWGTTSLTYVLPTAQSLLYLVAGGGVLPGFAVMLVAGTLLGAFLAARQAGQFRVEGFTDMADLRRHGLGAVLMGTGGALAGGCTVGQGLSGLSTMSFESALAVAAILFGGLRGVRYLETGRLLPPGVGAGRRGGDRPLLMRPSPPTGPVS